MDLRKDVDLFPDKQYSHSLITTLRQTFTAIHGLSSGLYTLRVLIH